MTSCVTSAGMEVPLQIHSAKAVEPWAFNGSVTKFESPWMVQQQQAEAEQHRIRIAQEARWNRSSEMRSLIGLIMPDSSPEAVYMSWTRDDSLQRAEAALATLAQRVYMTSTANAALCLAVAQLAFILDDLIASSACPGQKLGSGHDIIWRWLEHKHGADMLRRVKNKLEQTKSLWATPEDCEWWNERLFPTTETEEKVFIQSFNQLERLQWCRDKIVRCKGDGAMKRAFWATVLSVERTEKETHAFIEKECPPIASPPVAAAAASPLAAGASSSAASAEASDAAAQLVAVSRRAAPSRHVKCVAAPASASQTDSSAIAAPSSISGRRRSRRNEDARSASPVRLAKHARTRQSGPPQKRTTNASSSDEEVARMSDAVDSDSDSRGDIDMGVSDGQSTAGSSSSSSSSSSVASMNESQEEGTEMSIVQLHFIETHRLKVPLPFHHAVTAALRQGQVVLVTPAPEDTQGMCLRDGARNPQSYKTSYSMTFGCGNNNGTIVSPFGLADEQIDGMWRRVPSVDELLDFIEQDFLALKAGLHGINVPSTMSHRRYTKDVSERDWSDQKSAETSFFPKLAEKLTALASVCPQKKDIKAFSREEFAHRRQWLRQRWASLQKKTASGRQYFIHPLFLPELQFHRQSLANLSPVFFDGVMSYYLYLKVGFQFFNLHIEQMLFPFVHHQLEGESMWFIVPYSQLDKLYALAAEMYGLLYNVPETDEASKEERCVMGRALLYSKHLWPPHSLLRYYKIEFRKVTLRAGQVLMAHGGDAHFGFSTVSGRTVAVAVNSASSSWLQDGLPFVHAHFQWVHDKLMPLWSRLSERCKPTNQPSSPAALRQLVDHEHMVDKALSLCPANFTCTFLRSLNADLYAIEQGREPVCSYQRLPGGTVAQHRAMCQATIRLIHQCRNFTRERSICDACRSKRKRGECLCMDCGCGLDADDEWLDDIVNAAPTITTAALTLHPSITTKKARPSSVDPRTVVCAAPVPLSQASAIHNHLVRHGYVHVENVLSAALLEDLGQKLLPLARTLPLNDSATGATIIVAGTDVPVQYDEHPHVVLPSELRVWLDQLQREPQLLELARAALGADAVLDTHIYLRYRNNKHYTRLHSDFSFFKDNFKLDEHHDCSSGQYADVHCHDPVCQQKPYNVCTVWLPLVACGPSSGSLLLLPETRTLKSPHKQTASVPTSFMDDQRWSHLGCADTGYTVTSATMQPGSALLFAPTVVHGGSTNNSDVFTRVSLDIRIFASTPIPDTNSKTKRGKMAEPAPVPTQEQRVEIVESVVKHVTSLLKSKGKLNSHPIDVLLNNVYLFQLFLRNDRVLTDSIKANLQTLIAAAQPRLQQKFEAKSLDSQQQFQYRQVYEMQQQEDSERSAAVVEKHNKKLAELQSFIRELEKVQDRSDFADWTSEYLESWSEGLDAWTTEISFMSIIAGSEQTPAALKSLCKEFDALWTALEQKELMKRWLKLETRKWIRLITSILYLASHCIFAQTLYHTKPQQWGHLVGFQLIARLFRGMILQLQVWKHAELLTEAIAVLQLDPSYAADVSGMWGWLCSYSKPVSRLLNTAEHGTAHPLHLISTCMLALPS